MAEERADGTVADDLERESSETVGKAHEGVAAEAARGTSFDGLDEPVLSKRSRKPLVLKIVTALLIVIVFALGAGLVSGVIAPWWVAAKYNTISYVTEDEVTDYIESYRKQMGYEGSTDEAWATFLAGYNLTPQLLRASTVKQLVIAAEVRRKCSEEGVSVSSDELDQVMQNVKNNLAFGDDQTFEETLAAQGQTVEQARDGYEVMMLEQRLFEKVVESVEATDEETLDYIKSTYSSGVTAKHIYYFTIDGLDEEGSYEKFSAVQEVRKEFVSGKISKKRFEKLVEEHSNNTDLILRKGANGWSLDMDDYSEGYQEAVEGLEKGEVSQVFADSQGYSFVYIDSEYALPAGSSSYQLTDLPDTLQSYFKDSAGYSLWQKACNRYLNDLYEQSNTIVYAMPTDVSYYVDMSILNSEENPVEPSSEERANQETSESGGSTSE